MNNTSSSTDGGMDVLLKRIQALWPAAKGSVSEIRKPCIRPNCRACREGRKHRAFILSWNDGKHRRCMYVPSSLVDDLRKAIANGRRIEQILYQVGTRLIMQARKQR